MCHYITATMAPDGSLLPRAPDFSKTIKNLKKKGWSDTKIDRWVAQSKADIARKHEDAASRLSGPHPEIDRWNALVSAVLNGSHAKWIGLLVHWYGGHLTTEAIAVRNRRWVTLWEFHKHLLR